MVAGYYIFFPENGCRQYKGGAGSLLPDDMGVNDNILQGGDMDAGFRVDGIRLFIMYKSIGSITIGSWPDKKFGDLVGCNSKRDVGGTYLDITGGADIRGEVEPHDGGGGINVTCISYPEIF